MTVADLRKILANLPDDMLVICHQSEGGYTAYKEVSADVVICDENERREIVGKQCLYVGGWC